MIIEQNKVLQRSLIKAYWRKARRALAETTKPIVEMSREMQPEALQMMVTGLKNNEYIRTLIIGLWGDVGSRFATDFNTQIDNLGKDDYNWEEMFRTFAADAAAIKANSILGTQIEEARRIINLIENEGIREGWGIDKISAEITKYLKKDLPILQSWQAERIARTEVIGASNKGSFDAAVQSGLEMKKQWLTSGLKRTG